MGDMSTEKVAGGEDWEIGVGRKEPEGEKGDKWEKRSQEGTKESGEKNWG